LRVWALEDTDVVRREVLGHLCSRGGCSLLD
jgi:hypothetical protein